MRHQQPTDEALELAALYALGVLDPAETLRFESHLAEGCEVCDGEVKAFTAVVGHLGYASLEEAPPPAMRSRVFARVRVEAGSDRDWTIVRSTEGEWVAPGPEGLLVKRLAYDPVEQRFTALGRMEGGARYPSHRHADTEELYLLDGDLSVGGHPMRAGDYCAAASGTVHGSVFSAGGCTFLLSASERDEVAEGTGKGTLESGLVFVHSTEGMWRASGTEGVAVKPLFSDPARGAMSGLVRMQPGSRLPGQHQMVGEQFYVLEGDIHMVGQVLQAGDYYRGLRGTLPEATYTHDGCLFLVISSRMDHLRLAGR